VKKDVAARELQLLWDVAVYGLCPLALLRLPLNYGPVAVVAAQTRTVIVAVQVQAAAGHHGFAERFQLLLPIK
jgi:hypothetical protein